MLQCFVSQSHSSAITALCSYRETISDALLSTFVWRRRYWACVSCSWWHSFNVIVFFFSFRGRQSKRRRIRTSVDVLVHVINERLNKIKRNRKIPSPFLSISLLYLMSRTQTRRMTISLLCLKGNYFKAPDRGAVVW